MRKYIRDKATARHVVASLEGAYLDFDEMPAGTVTEARARAFCSEKGMRYRDSFTGAGALFDAFYRKLQRSPGSRRPRNVPAARPAPRIEKVLLEDVRSGEKSEMSYDSFCTEPPGPHYRVISMVEERLEKNGQKLFNI